MASQMIGLLPRLRRYARVLTVQPDAADDLVADTLSRAHRTTVDTVEPPSAVSVMAIMHRLHQARRGRRGRIERGRAKAVTPPADAAASASDIMDLVWQLPVDEREILMLVAVERLTYDEVAALLEVPPATVIARLSRARANLRGLMEGVGSSE